MIFKAFTLTAVQNKQILFQKYFFLQKNNALKMNSESSKQELFSTPKNTYILTAFMKKKREN